MSIHVAIAPNQVETRVLVLYRAHQPLLKARLAQRPHHPRALPTLLEALALWQGEKVHAALIADDQVSTSDTSLFTDCFDVVEPTPLFHLAVIGRMTPRPRHNTISGLGHFGDLQRFLAYEVIR